MDIKNIKTNNKGLYYYQTKDFASIYIRHYFYLENSDEEELKANILKSYLFKTNSKYKTVIEIKNKEKDLYQSIVNGEISFLGKKIILSFTLRTIDQKVIEDNIFDDAVNFFKDILLKPNFKDGKLDKEVFNQIKRDLINNQKNYLKNPDIMQRRLRNKNVFIDSPINVGNFTNIEDYEKLINSIKEKDIVDFYNELINNRFITSFAFGNLEDKDISLIEKSFNFKKGNFDYKYHYKENIIDKDIEIISNDTTQSYIYFIYKVKDFKKENEHLYRVLPYILNGSNGPVYNVYRTKLGLVYHASASIFSIRDVLMINVQIDKKNKDKSIDALKMVFDILHDKKEIEKLLKFGKERLKEITESSTEKLGANIEELENYCLKLSLSNEEILKQVNTLTVEDITNYIDNLEYKCMYYYKGDKDET